MGFFGMSEKELQEFREKMEALELTLKNRESDIQRDADNLKHQQQNFDADKTAFEEERRTNVEEMKRNRAEIAKEKAELEKKRQELIRQEEEAKAGFADEQEKVFQEVIEKRIADLDGRETELNAFSKKIADDSAKLTEREGQIAKRELEVTKREQLADADFADKTAELAKEAKRQHEANIQKAEELSKREEALVQEMADLEKAKEAVRQRERQVTDAEAERDAGYADERKNFDEELQAKRSAWQVEENQKRDELSQRLTEQENLRYSALESEIAATRETRLSDVKTAADKERDRIISEANQEAERIRQVIAQERTTWEKELSDLQEKIKTQNIANEKKAGELSAKEDSLLGREQELQSREEILEKRYDGLEDLLEDRVEERKTSFETKEREYQEEIQRLRDSLDTQSRLVGAFEQLKRQLNDEDPAKVLRDLNFANGELARLRDELANRPSAEMRNRFEDLEKQFNEQKERAERLENELQQNESTIAETGELRRKLNDLESENRSLRQRLDRAETDAKAANDELKRLRSAFERPDEVIARYNEIEMPRISIDDFTPPQKMPQAQNKGSDRIDEVKWLDDIYEKCDDYGIHFSKRILKAFHTAIKTAEWSPITILAGVSGTGKSELPRLYSHFGGMLFEPLSVQPNWDSQESMLGFFNSIDNKFDAQPVLRFLAQSQQPSNLSYKERLARWEKMAGAQFDFDQEKHKDLLNRLQNSVYPGTDNCMGMVLLDEMNLAHPELYFAEFLSKLELRRGKTAGDLPFLPVKIGAGLPPYELPLGRNVLWVGTMNQDETTKSLSDKVLDRSIIIYFPRPTQLVSRKKLMPLKDANRKLIHKDDFQQWWAKGSDLPDELIVHYKQFIEKINASLGIAGRAIGHRVWQSVEYYMANYPDVRAALRNGGDLATVNAAMHVAFEDQLVQKVMPKLRGIDTRGKFGKCLDEIQGLLNTGIGDKAFVLDEDFQLARDLGHGQFMWQSANYLNENDRLIAPTEIADEFENTSQDVINDNQAEAQTPPDWFRPGDEKRIERWNKMSPERQHEIIESNKRQPKQ